VKETEDTESVKQTNLAMVSGQSSHFINEQFVSHTYSFANQHLTAVTQRRRIPEVGNYPLALLFFSTSRKEKTYIN